MMSRIAPNGLPTKATNWTTMISGPGVDTPSAKPSKVTRAAPVKNNAWSVKDALASRQSDHRADRYRPRNEAHTRTFTRNDPAARTP